MTNTEEKSTLETAVKQALATPEPEQQERKPYLFETVGRTFLKGNKFPVGKKAQAELKPKVVNNQVVELHKPRTVVNHKTKTATIVGVSIMVKSYGHVKFWHEGKLISKAEHDKLFP